MPVSGIINIALCFNNVVDAIKFSEQLEAISSNINFVIGASLGEFVKAIGQQEKIDCFIIEAEFTECSAIDLVEKLKKSERYKKSVISIYTPNLDEINKKFLEMGTHYNFDSTITVHEVISHLKKLINKNLMPVIPSHYNVMVLDNTPEVLDLISMHLNDLGHRKIDLCQTIHDAQKNLLEKDYDLLLLDWNLDDGTCIDLIEFIQKSAVSPRTKDAVVVVITGRDDVDDIMTLLRYGVKDHIIKPFEFSEFEDKISYALEKHNK